MAAKNDSQNEAGSQEENGPRLDLSGQFQWSLNGTALKRLIPIISTLLLGGGSFWGIWTLQQNKPASAPIAPTVEPPTPDRLPSSSITQRYSCREIGNYQKAQELLAEGHAYLDGDGDGVACDSLR